MDPTLKCPPVSSWLPRITLQCLEGACVVTGGNPEQVVITRPRPNKAQVTRKVTMSENPESSSHNFQKNCKFQLEV